MNDVSRKDVSRTSRTLGQRTIAYWQRYWLVRWLVANSLGWSVGIFALSLALRWLGVWGLVIAWGLVGAMIGGAQAWALRTLPAGMWQPHGRAWVGWSAAALLLVSLPIYPLLLVILAFNHWLLLIAIGGTIGLLIGAALGMAQYRLLIHEYDDAGMWILANLIGGVLCAPITLQTLQWGLPIIASPGLLIFGWLTGWAWWWLARD